MSKLYLANRMIESLELNIGAKVYFTQAGYDYMMPVFKYKKDLIKYLGVKNPIEGIDYNVLQTTTKE